MQPTAPWSQGGKYWSSPGEQLTRDVPKAKAESTSCTGPGVRQGILKPTPAKWLRLCSQTGHCTGCVTLASCFLSTFLPCKESGRRAREAPSTEQRLQRQSWSLGRPRGLNTFPNAPALHPHDHLWLPAQGDEPALPLKGGQPSTNAG